MTKLAGGRRPGAGRRKGSRGRKTLEREERARLIEEVRRKIEDADAAAIETRTREKKLAKDILREIMELYMGMAARVQPWPDERGKNPKENPAAFHQYLDAAKDAAKSLAPFESPRYSAVVVGASVVTKIVIEGGLGLPPFGTAKPMIEGKVIEELPPGTTITADELELPQSP